MSKCSDVMTKDPVWVLPEDTVTKAAQIMERENVGSLPVCDGKTSQKLVGIVTDRDLTLKVLAHEQDAQTTNVKAVMTPRVVSCMAEDDLQVALDAMAQHQLRRIPIVDRQNRIIGIIAQADVATRLNQPQQTAAVVREISQEKNP